MSETVFCMICCDIYAWREDNLVIFICMSSYVCPVKESICGKEWDYGSLLLPGNMICPGKLLFLLSILIRCLGSVSPIQIVLLTITVF